MIPRGPSLDQRQLAAGWGAWRAEQRTRDILLKGPPIPTPRDGLVFRGDVASGAWGGPATSSTLPFTPGPPVDLDGRIPGSSELMAFWFTMSKAERRVV